MPCPRCVWCDGQFAAKISLWPVFFLGPNPPRAVGADVLCASPPSSRGRLLFFSVKWRYNTIVCITLSLLSCVPAKRFDPFCGPRILARDGGPGLRHMHPLIRTPRPQPACRSFAAFPQQYSRVATATARVVSRGLQRLYPAALFREISFLFYFSAFFRFRFGTAPPLRTE